MCCRYACHKAAAAQRRAVLADPDGGARRSRSFPVCRTLLRQKYRAEPRADTETAVTQTPANSLAQVADADKGGRARGPAQLCARGRGRREKRGQTGDAAARRMVGGRGGHCCPSDRYEMTSVRDDSQSHIHKATAMANARDNTPGAGRIARYTKGVKPSSPMTPTAPALSMDMRCTWTRARSGGRG